MRATRYGCNFRGYSLSHSVHTNVVVSAVVVSAIVAVVVIVSLDLVVSPVKSVVASDLVSVDLGEGGSPIGKSSLLPLALLDSGVVAIVAFIDVFDVNCC